MSLKEDIVAHKSRLNSLETDLVGLELKADKLRESLQAQISSLRQVRELSPEAIADIALRLSNELIVIREKAAEAAAIRQTLGN